MDNLHEALQVEQVGQTTSESMQWLLIRLRHSKTHSLLTVHANPTGYTTYGAQRTDVLATLGFHRRLCHFFHGECFVQTVPEGFDLAGFSTAFNDAFATFFTADKHFERCGLLLPKPEGWGFFGHSASQPQLPNYPTPASDGHRAPEVNRLNTAEDAVFRYVLSWITGARDKGWTIHLRPQHPPWSNEIQGAFAFLEAFRDFSQCPEFDFEPCLWRFWPSDSSGHAFQGAAGSVHSAFDALPMDFTPGIEMLLKTHATAASYGMGFLPLSSGPPAPKPTPPLTRLVTGARPGTRSSPTRPYKYDVALSFAGTERPLAEELATILRDKNVEVFYDYFYPEHLWGKDLGSHFDRIYRSESRFCAIFVSDEYKKRMWTNAERRSAVARSVADVGIEYILPIRVEDVDLDGILPTIGHVDVRRMSIPEIAELLLKKLSA